MTLRSASPSIFLVFALLGCANTDGASVSDASAADAAEVVTAADAVVATDHALGV